MSIHLYIIESLFRLPKNVILISGLAIVFIIGVADYYLGLSILLFYLMPILLVAWFADKNAGILVSICSTFVWLAADLLSKTHSPHSAIPYWEMVVELGVFLIITYTVSALAESRQRQAELIQFVIHDLKSPLTNMLAGLQTLQQHSNMAKEEIWPQSLVEMALVSGNRMEALINSLLDRARLDEGKFPLHLKQVSVGELIEPSLTQVAMWAQRSGITLKPVIAENPITVFADPSLSMRILVNLLSNAIKISPRGSVVTIRVALCDENKVSFSVTDQGPGIPPEWEEKVFDKFAQIEARKQGVAVGSGLGLTFCHLAVKAQGGSIRLRNRAEGGVTVTFTLPAKTR